MRDSEIQEENRLYSQQLKLCTQQAQERESYYLDLRRIRHDLKNHLYAIQGMLESNDIEGSKKAKIIIKTAKEGGSADPLEQRNTVGWKVMFTAKRLQELAMVRIESGVTA